MPNRGQRLPQRPPVWAEEAKRLREERNLSYAQIRRIINSKFSLNIKDHTSIRYWVLPGCRDKIAEYRHKKYYSNTKQTQFNFEARSASPAE